MEENIKNSEEYIEIKNKYENLIDRIKSYKYNLNTDISENELKSRFEYLRVKKNISKTKCAEVLNVSRGTLYRRLENPSRLTLRELLKLRDLFGLDLIDDIFSLKNINDKKEKNEIKEGVNL